MRGVNKATFTILVTPNWESDIFSKVLTNDNI